MALRPEQWSRVEALFEEAQGLPTASRRDFAAGLSGEERDVRQELAALLLAAEGTDELLDRPLAVTAPADEPASLSPGTRLGPWRVGERIGRGGMGEVFAALRADGAFEGAAALKVLKRGLDTEAVVARFVRERNILARLTHPNIAHLLDAGATPDGRPYLVMERVQGEPITDHCRRRGTSVREVLALVATVCDAVHEAHRQLVVHRDLKPSNVFVADDGRVKLLDFGIAKLLADPGGEETVGGGPVLLTPAYAAPEQLLGEPATTATDVYALGVLLYQLLTGEMPHRRESASLAALAVSRGEEGVTAPSAVLVQKTRGGPADPAGERRARELRGDLDLIVMKALHREPERRYRSAAELGDDLRRYLERRPVSARPDSPAYRFSRLVRRHRAASVAAAVAVLALFGGLGLALWQRDAARRAARQAEDQRQRAERVKAFVLSLFEEQDPFRRAQAQARPAKELVEQGLARLEAELGAEPSLQSELLGDLGVVQINLSDLAGAEKTFTRALELQKGLPAPDAVQVARFEGFLARAEVQTGRLPEAGARIERALPVLEPALGEDHLEVVALRRVQVRLLVNGSRFEEALGASRRVVASYTRVRGPDDPETALALVVQGMALIELGRFEEAEAALQDSVARLERSRGPDHAQLVYPFMHLATVRKRSGRVPEALEANARVLALQRKQLGPEHVLVGRVLADRGDMLRQVGRLDEAERALREAEAILEPLQNQELGVLMLYRGRLALQREGFAEAERAFARAAEIYAKTLGESAVDTWGARVDRGVALARLGRPAEALRLQEEAVQAVRRLAGEGSPAFREVQAKLTATRGGEWRDSRPDSD